MSTVTINSDSERPSTIENKTDEVRNVYMPIFKEEQVNRRTEDNEQTTENIPLKEILQSNLSATIDASINAFGDEETMIWVCIAKKVNGQHHMGMLGTALYGEKTLNIKVGLDIPTEIAILGNGKK